MQRSKFESIVTAVLVVVFAAAGINAAGPLFMWNSEQRIPYRYDVTTPIPVYTDIGPFEIVPPQYTPIPNEVADGIVAWAFQQWTDVETSAFQAQVVGDFASIGLPDVNNAATAAQVIGPDNGGGIHVIYDADGQVLRQFFGVSPSVLGIASPEWADESTGILTESWVVINAQPRWVGDDQLLNYAGVFTHEFGHAINLAHSQTTGAIAFYNDARGPANCSTLPYPTTVSVNNIETMYPFISPRPGTGTGLAQSTVDLADDKASISNLYPAPGYPENRGTIKGQILDPKGKTGITGLNIIARNIADPFGDAVSAMSGDYVRVETGTDGTFTLNGLTPGAQYVLHTDSIVTGGFPTRQPFFLPGPEEFYNGASESGDGVKDNKCQAEVMTAVAGSPIEADVLINKVKGAPEFIPLPPTTIPTSITGDGRLLAGNVSNGPVFTWSETDGAQVLSETISTSARMSRDGTAISGEELNADGQNVASLLKSGSGWQALPFPEGTTLCGADYTKSYGVAGGGKAVSGMVYLANCRPRPFLWTPEGGSVILPTPANTNQSRPNTISEDGSTVVGWFNVTGSGFRRGARWVNGDFQEFSTADLTVGEASNTTPDGSVITGGGAGNTGDIWRWTSSTGVQRLGRVRPFGPASGNAISDDGSVIAGLGGSSSVSPAGRVAFLWTKDMGMVEFDSFLRSQGTYIEGWILNAALSMSSDGRSIAGYGFGPRSGGGWLVKLDKVNICHAPPGNPTKAHTINVDFPYGMQTHLDHGDTIGLCIDEDQ